MYTMKKAVFFAVFMLGCLAGFTQKPQKIKWLTVNEAQQMQQKEQKKIFIDVYTDWCGWCKKMDANTFNHPVISKLLTKYYHCVKLDAENGDTIYFSNQKFFKMDTQKRTPNEFAVNLLNGKMSYPTTVYLDENFQSLGPVPGYLEPQMMEKILIFFGENHYKTTEWKVFEKNFKGEIIVEEHGY